MAIEIVDLPTKNGGSFHSYVSLPEGTGDLLDSVGDFMVILWDCSGFDGPYPLVWPNTWLLNMAILK